MTKDRKSVKGSCLCGAVAYEVEARLKRFYFCHCAQCRKLTGSAFAANIQAEPAAVTWLRGADEIRRYDYEGEGSYSRVFCKKCASPLPFLNEGGNTLYIPAGSVDGDLGLLPDLNIFWADRADWYEQGAGSPNCERFPD